MTSRCSTYWTLMTARDRAAAAVANAEAEHPDGGGLHPDITYALGVLATAQADQTRHLQTCPVCGEWRDEIRILAETAPVAQEEEE